MKAAVEHLKEDFAFSERRACEVNCRSDLPLPLGACDADLREKLVDLAWEKPRFGYRCLHVLLRRDGEQVNHKRVWRVYREAGLCVKRRKRKRLVRAGVLAIATAANQEWALDFAADVLATGRTDRVLGVVDTFTRECLALEADTSFASRRVTRVLEQIIRERRNVCVFSQGGN